MQNCYTRKSSREAAADQDERLTSKHIQTLGFLQEIVNENKALKARVEELEEQLGKCAELHALAENSQERIKQIQEQYMNRADEINSMLTEKHRVEIMQLVEEKIEVEKRCSSEKEEMQLQIENLKKTCSDLQAQLEEYKQQDGKTEIMSLKIKALEQECDRLRGENNDLKQMTSGQLGELSKMQSLQQKIAELEQWIAELNQKNKELEYTISRQQRLLEENGGSSGTEQADLIDSLRKKLVKLHNEKMAFTLKDVEYQDIIEQLKAEISQLKDKIKDLELGKSKLETDLKNALQEIARLRGKPTNENVNFKDFVQLKRDMAILKEENEELRGKFKSSKHILPKLRADPVGSSVTKQSVSSKSDTALAKISHSTSKLQDISQPMALVAVRSVGSAKSSHDKKSQM